MGPSFMSLFLLVIGIHCLLKLTSYLITAHQNRKFAKSHNCLPPRRLPSAFWGLPNWVHIMRAAKRGDVLEHIASRFPKYGNTWKGRILFVTSIGTIEPENIKTILATGFKDFSLGSERHDNFYPLLGDGIFTLDGAGWEHSRANLRPQFSRDQISDIEALEVHVQRLMNRLPEGDGKVADLQPLFYCLTLDSATEFLFGESVDSLLSPELNPTGAVSGRGGEEQMSFARAFNVSQAYLIKRARLRGLYWMINPPRFRRSNAIVHALVDRYVDMALHPEKRTRKVSGKYVFLDAIAAETKDAKYLRDQCLNILLAGRDTTAGLLGFTFWLLARHPHVYQKLREEILSAFGTSRNGEGRRPSFSALKDVTYLRYVLNETLRLYPSVPLNGRTAVRNTILPRGGGEDGLSPVFIPKGQRVDYTCYGLHRRKDLYGEDADSFRPERWAEGVGRGWEFLPFNGGPRICLGQQYALTEAAYTVTRILQKYARIEVADTYTGPMMDLTLTMAPKKVLLKLWKA
ncbi:cytochrome P450 [Choiromyces venosus 120613-1]|uniref:Cytochrome P450 n=1 Tax=Choiromyces venosus 120613-1 TaxID=1336337 RepID=A0A3N4JWY4_9PEZI|nr:cytochrome P450 [Choiromyces venosus 120613-1]